jgi:hypothetical protein
MLLAAVDFCPDHLQRIEQRLDDVGPASRICALPIGQTISQRQSHPPLSSIGQNKRTGTSRAAPRTLIFKLRMIAFMFKTSVEEFDGRRGMRRIAPSPATVTKAVIQSRRKTLILLRIEHMRREWKIHDVWPILKACAAMM